MYYIKIKDICSFKTINKREKDKPQTGGREFQYLSLTLTKDFQIYKAVLQINNEKGENSIRKWTNVTKDNSREKTSKTENKRGKRHLVSLVIGKMQITIIMQIPQYTFQMAKMEKTDNLEQLELSYSATRM